MTDSDDRDIDDRHLSAMRPIRLRKAADEVVAALTDGIRAGLWEPGDLLPRERDLAAKMEVSRTTVREATNILERAGVLTIKRGNSGGFTVTTRSVPADLIDGGEALGRSGVRALLEARRAIETSTAVLAGVRASAEQLDDLQRLVDGLDELLDEPEEFIELDFRFHLRVAEVSGNAVLPEFLDEIFRRHARIRQQYPVGHIALEVGIANQRATLEAIRGGDKRTILADIDRHLGLVEAHFLGEPLLPLTPTR